MKKLILSIITFLTFFGFSYNSFAFETLIQEKSSEIKLINFTKNKLSYYIGKKYTSDLNYNSDKTENPITVFYNNLTFSGTFSSYKYGNRFVSFVNSQFGDAGYYTYSNNSFNLKIDNGLLGFYPNYFLQPNDNSPYGVEKISSTNINSFKPFSSNSRKYNCKDDYCFGFNTSNGFFKLDLNTNQPTYLDTQSLLDDNGITLGELKAYNIVEYIFNGKETFIFSITFDDGENQKFASYILNGNTFEIIAKNKYFLSGNNNSKLFFIDEGLTENRINTTNYHLIIGGIETPENANIYYQSGLSFYNFTTEYKEFDSGNEQTCKIVPLSYPYDVDYTNNFLIEYRDDNSYTLVTKYDETSLRQASFFINNIDNLDNFGFYSLSDGVTFSASNNILRFLGNTNALPKIIISGDFDGRGFFRIDGNGPSENLGYQYNCETKEINYSNPYKFNTEYIFNSDRLCIALDGGYGQYNFTKISYGENKIQYVDSEVCTDSVGNILVDGEPFDGDLENPGNRNIIEEFKKEEKNKNFYQKIEEFLNFFLDILKLPSEDNDFTENKFYLFITSLLERIPGFSEMINIISVQLPEEPNLNINIPFFNINTPGKIGYQTINTDLPIVNDKLNISIIEENENGKLFISFILGILYIGFRILIFGLIFYIFTLFWKFSNKILNTFFGGFVSKDIRGNFWALAIFVSMIIIIYSTLFALFSYITPILPMINELTNYVTVFFSYIAFSFFSYSFFAALVNLFFVSVATLIIFIIVYRLITTFVRIN